MVGLGAGNEDIFEGKDGTKFSISSFRFSVEGRNGEAASRGGSRGSPPSPGRRSPRQSNPVKASQTKNFFWVVAGVNWKARTRVEMPAAAVEGAAAIKVNKGKLR